MKRLIAAVLLVAMVMTMCVSAFAETYQWTEGWTINPKDGGTWKKSPYNHTMPDSGSYWKAKYNGPADASSAYIYKQSTGRATHIESFSKGADTSRLNYLSGMKVVGKTYWIVGSGTNGASVNYSYSF